MKRINWDEFKDGREIMEYLGRLPRYRNTALKSLYYRGLFFLNLIYCRLFNIDKPLFIVLVTNNGCNLNCTYCYGGYGERRMKDYSTKELLQIFDELKRLGTRLITLHGGEALLRKDIGEVINYAKLNGIYISLNTNGYFVEEKIQQIKPVDTVCLSLDGREENNDKNRGSGCYKKVLESIEILKRNKVPVVISATLTRDTVDDMDFLAELARGKGCFVQYSILYNSEALKESDLNLALDDSGIRKVIGKILELKRSGYPVYYSENVLTSTINWPISLEEKRYATKDDDFVKGHRMIPCYHGRLKFQIDADGRVVTCWAHDDADAPNVKELGVGKAIEECRRRDICRYCTFLANNEHNALMHMSPRNIWNILRIQVRDALKIGYRR